MIARLVRPIERFLLTRFFGKIFWAPIKVKVLAEQDGKYLVLKTGDLYDLPGGLLKSGELLEEAARREFKEETGLELDEIELTDVKGGADVTVYFSGSFKEDEASGSLNERVEMVSREEVEELEWRPGIDWECLGL